jgi:hypothetical protein
VAQLYPRALGSLSVASYDSRGLRWKYSNPPPHGVEPEEIRESVEISQSVGALRMDVTAEGCFCACVHACAYGRVWNIRNKLIYKRWKEVQFSGKLPTGSHEHCDVSQYGARAY